MIRIVIAEDQRILRGALGNLLDFEEDMEVVGEAENGKEALYLIQTKKPDICLLDIEMPIISGLEVAEELKKSGSTCRVIILTTFARPGYFERAVKAGVRSEEHTSELQSRGQLVCRLLLENKKHRDAS